MEAYRKAKSISIYMSMPKGEVMTRSIIKDAIGLGKVVYVPYIAEDVTTSNSDQKAGVKKGKHMDMVSLHSLADFNRCEEHRDKWGIPTVTAGSLPNRRSVIDHSDAVCSPLPRKYYVHWLTRPQNLETINLDLVVMPGVAFDLNCRRLGHGKGFYDEFLSRYRIRRSDTAKQEKRMPYLSA